MSTVKTILTDYVQSHKNEISNSPELAEAIKSVYKKHSKSTSHLKEHAARMSMTLEEVVTDLIADELAKLAGKKMPTVEAARKQMQRAPEVEYFDDLPADLVAPVEICSDPEDEANKAIEKLGTDVEKKVWATYKRYRTQKEAAAALGIDASTFSRTMNRCELKIRQYHSMYADWEDVYRSEVRRHC